MIALLLAILHMARSCHCERDGWVIGPVSHEPRCIKPTVRSRCANDTPGWHLGAPGIITCTRDCGAEGPATR